MDKLFEHLPEVISAAAQSYLGTFALLSVALSVLAYVFFAKAREKVKVAVFVLLFVGVLGFGVAMFRASASTPITSPPAGSAASLSKEAKRLLKGAAADPSGLVLYEQFGDSVDLHTNGVSLLTSKADHQELMTWEAALQELVKSGLFVDRGEHGEVYELTKAGYDAAKREN
jgi:ABC-type transport system involved in cytochrome bd biosynthesis fused ATPase/permease subunit